MPHVSRAKPSVKSKPPHSSQRRYSEADLLRALQRIVAAHGPALTLCEFCRQTGIGATTINARFGGWLAFRERAGLSRQRSYAPGGRCYSRELVMERLRAVVQQAGRHVTKDEFCRRAGMSSSTVLAYWGSWRKLKAAAGLPALPKRHKLIAEFDLLFELHRVVRTLGRIPTQREIDRYCRFPYATYFARYRSLGALTGRYDGFVKQLTHSLEASRRLQEQGAVCDEGGRGAADGQPPEAAPHVPVCPPSDVGPVSV
jgi:hypothetical protein